MLIGVPAVNPWGDAVLTVICGPEVPPLPDSILIIEIGSVANAPTISHSGLCIANPWGFGSVVIRLSGYFWSISLPDAKLKAFDSLL